MNTSGKIIISMIIPVCLYFAWMGGSILYIQYDNQYLCPTGCIPEQAEFATLRHDIYFYTLMLVFYFSAIYSATWNVLRVLQGKQQNQVEVDSIE